MKLFGAEKSLELQSTFSFVVRESFQLAQAGNSLHSIWAASLVGSEPLIALFFESRVNLFGGLC